MRTLGLGAAGRVGSGVFFFSLAFEDPPAIENNKAWVGSGLSLAEHPASFIHVRDRAGGTAASPVVLRRNDLFGATRCDYLADHPSLAGRLIVDGGVCPSAANSLGRFAGTVRAGSWVDLADARAGHRKVKRATAGRDWTVES